jgi:hypothetical protein
MSHRDDMDFVLASLVDDREWKTPKKISPNRSFLRKGLQARKLHWSFADAPQPIRDFCYELRAQADALRLVPSSGLS